MTKKLVVLTDAVNRSIVVRPQMTGFLMESYGSGGVKISGAYLTRDHAIKLFRFLRDELEIS